ncbi:hypothetical protein A5731_19600 [Mycolicibacterium conceptionense]|uniref:Secreted protein n=1 Tax=Mycolicibacterium conceptionense TaxID=451644 RepID=A0A1A1X5T9_9MYCO|nr:hypothetical protein A5718_12645 [Mycolicibacterium conceptionense]OBF00635.1 hypothetical protein A5731_19600 [Mycolicibacterium conceptionense]OBF14523.1 hypothetical protein A5726_23780 [Mycolicibacterium conceptionense]OBF47717.1 hypothetical protein A5720_04325 [Mycolicibacterium conceptionense]OBI02334.1 hypothetical protein A5716_01675 [Mycolicibacterium conceptionense]
MLVLIAAATVAALTTAPSAAAAFCDPTLNGAYRAVSDGTWAKTNEIFHDEATVASTWTVNTTCSSETYDCAGEVSSSQGWDAPIRCDAAGLWSVRRHLDRWEPCHDGTAAPADQLLYFSPDLSGSPSFDEVSSFSGWDRTVGISGGCGINRPLVIEMPFQLTRIQ